MQANPIACIWLNSYLTKINLHKEINKQQTLKEFKQQKNMNISHPQDPNTFTIKKFVFIGISGLADKFEQNQTGGRAD